MVDISPEISKIVISAQAIISTFMEYPAIAAIVKVEKEENKI